MEAAELITSILALFAGTAQLPDVACTSRVAGSEHIKSATWILEDRDKIISVNNSIIEHSASRKWILTDKHVRGLKPIILDQLAAILSNQPSPFTKTVLTGVLIYSKSAFTSDPIEKVIYVLTALESLLLKSESESIQQNLSERLAVFIVSGLIERKAVIRTVREVYAIRSRYLHHGKTSEELNVIGEFLSYAWKFWLQLAPNILKFKNKEAFVAAIDDHKLS